MITVFGATGYTGRLVSEELARLGADFAIAGRSGEKLSRLQERLGDRPQVIVAEVADRRSLVAMCEKSSVVISCAGPFLEIGRPVVEAALEGGAHYLDTCGEQLFIKELLGLDESARRAGKAIVSAVATEFLPTDCLADLTASGLERTMSVDTLTFLSFKPSVGTTKSAIGMLARDGFSYIGGEWVKERIARSTRSFDLPVGGRVGGFSYPGGDVITIPRHVTAARVRSYLTFPSMSPWTARIAALGVCALPALFRSPVGGWVKGRLERRGTEGPRPEERSTDSFCFAVESIGRLRGEQVRRIGVISGSDVYGMTAAIASKGAILMSAGDYDKSGVLAPAQAFDPRSFLDYLSGFGVEWKIIEEQAKGGRR